MSAGVVSGAELADATRTAIAMCAASHRGDLDRWALLAGSGRRSFLIAAFTGVVRFLADRIASANSVPVEDLYSAILTEAFLDLVELVSPGPYLELFARRNRLGWSTWGNECLDHGVAL